MYRRTRRAVVCGVVASSVAFGGAVVLGPAAAAAAVPAASCTVTPAADGLSVVITGEGFTPPRSLNDGESTEPLNIDANGNFRLKRFQKNVDYTVLAVNEDQDFVFVNCKVAEPKAPSPSPSTAPSTGPAQDFQKGFNDGYVAGQRAAETCQPTKPDTSQPRSDSYRKGWTAGFNTVFNELCEAGSTG
ncbi:hypothetical protein [Streptomyces sp. NBC_00091]|uniref:hypothetical protein n=1 Tax=Streptomyces sp. NBC_00091 TaxID=2975648 RepID=UPI00224D2404|nr:hypothetical protein [Streptomyces sp. NBC_00091]MCX5376386.1 hypothetical protein [Streptomyces sp. NBC_00091]